MEVEELEAQKLHEIEKRENECTALLEKEKQKEVIVQSEKLEQIRKESNEAQDLTTGKTKEVQNMEKEQVKLEERAAKKQEKEQKEYLQILRKEQKEADALEAKAKMAEE